MRILSVEYQTPNTKQLTKITEKNERIQCGRWRAELRANYVK